MAGLLKITMHLSILVSHQHQVGGNPLGVKEASRGLPTEEEKDRKVLSIEGQPNLPELQGDSLCMVLSPQRLWQVTPTD